MMTKIENAVIRKYGFEHKITIMVFRITEIFHRGKLYRYDISDCPFEPSTIDGHTVLCIHGNTAICG